MGLYIPNAKIPVSCNKCYKIGLAHRLRDLGGHCPRMDLHYSPDEQDFKGDRRADCPLLDVPPHGRLIEKNAVFELIRSMPDVDRQLPVTFMKALYELPTVIPAEEGET